MSHHRWRASWDDPMGSALVAVVPEAAPIVDPVRRRFDPSAGIGVPPHVTALYPFVEPADLTDEVERDVAAAVEDVAAFGFRLTGVRAFEDVVYLTPDPAEPFVALTQRLCERFPGFPPFGGRFDTVIPHLTVGHTAEGATTDVVAEALAPSLPIVAVARTLTLLVEEDDGWVVRRSFPLSS